MALNKLYYVYGLDTSCFYTDEEKAIEQRIIKARCLRALLKTKKQDWKLNVLNRYIGEHKQKLKDVIKGNVDLVRSIRPEKINDHKIVSTFDSSLTRCFGMKADEVNEEIIIVKVYFFDVARSIILNGFTYNGHRYVFFSSSAGQIRTKKMVCVREDLLQQHWNTLTAGLGIKSINAQGGMNKNKFLAYLALCNSATDVWEDFDIDRTIVIDDFETNVNGLVDYIDDKSYTVERVQMDVPITHTDGVGMILPSLSDHNFMVRLPWMKGLLGVFDFVEFIRTHGCSPIVTDIYGQAHDIIEENIQIIFTKSQFKMWKYFTDWNDYKYSFKRYGCQAGYCNREEDEIDYSRINYQMLQTLVDMTDDELNTVSQATRDELYKLTHDKDTMLKVFGATETNTRLNYFQKSLMLYPELLSDLYTRTTLKEIKTSLEKDAWSGKLKIDGKYTFILPDLYAACEHWFLGEEQPRGLLQNGEVYCSLFPTGKLDCLRSPHLYKEHAVRNNVSNEQLAEWFITPALYTSTFDLISKILQFDDH